MVSMSASYSATSEAVRDGAPVAARWRLDGGAWQEGLRARVAAPLDHADDGVHVVAYEPAGGGAGVRRDAGRDAPRIAVRGHHGITVDDFEAGIVDQHRLRESTADVDSDAVGLAFIHATIPFSRTCSSRSPR